MKAPFFMRCEQTDLVGRSNQMVAVMAMKELLLAIFDSDRTDLSAAMHENGDRLDASAVVRCQGLLGIGVSQSITVRCCRACVLSSTLILNVAEQ